MQIDFIVYFKCRIVDNLVCLQHTPKQ